MTKLAVGKIYQHASDNSDERTLFKITERWGPDLFVGQSYEEASGLVSGEPRWMFNSFGHALGFAGNMGGPLNWRIKEYNPKKYEVFMFFSDDGNGERWEDVVRGSPWTSDTLYLVRENGDTENARMMSHEEFCSLVDDITS